MLSEAEQKARRKAEEEIVRLVTDAMVASDDNAEEGFRKVAAAAAGISRLVNMETRYARVWVRWAVTGQEMHLGIKPEQLAKPMAATLVDGYDLRETP